jgi:hypothetical protein
MWSYYIPAFGAASTTGKKNASFGGWRFLEIVVHLLTEHYPFSARGIEK